jgi:pyroglutamyl-peptidase
MAQATLVEGLRIAVISALNTTDDVLESGGQIS